MLIHPVVQHLGGIVTVSLQASFVGDETDDDDKIRIAGWGDPKVNLAGSFSVQSGESTLTFAFPVAEYFKGVTTEMQNSTARFMTQLPVAALGQPATVQGPLDCVTSDPIVAAEGWASTMDERILFVVDLLRAKDPAQLTTLPDATV